MNQGARRRAACLLGPLLMLGATGTVLAQPVAEDAAVPWRLQEALGVAPWLRFGLEHRTRVEHLDNDFRRNAPGDHSMVALRTLLPVELGGGPVLLGGELQDARAFAGPSTPLNTNVVNTFEVLQAYAGFRLKNVIGDGDALSLQIGRLTMDVGSRRLIARNDFRNTSNAFTGMDVRWTSRHGDLARGFVVVPVIRRPGDLASLETNEFAIDRENTDALLWGLLYDTQPLSADMRLEAYLIGFHERDGARPPPSLHRRLATVGGRVLRAPKPGRFDVQLEIMGQGGWSRDTPEGPDLQHRALSLHVSSGRRFDVPWSPRLSAVYDFASGDHDPRDGRNGRFDPLFGARRFEWGPTSLFGPLARSNVSAPGLRLDVSPRGAVEAFASFRLVWLPARKDAWVPSGLRDPMGASGRFVGQHLEARVRWHVLPRNLSLELGAAGLLRGRFAEQAPDGRDSPSFYLYSQVTGTI